MAPAIHNRLRATLHKPKRLANREQIPLNWSVLGNGNDRKAKLIT